MLRFTAPLEPGQPVPSFETAYYFVFALSAVLLILFWIQAWGLHGIGKKEGVKNAWLAWIPGLGGWILGSLEESRKLRGPMLFVGILTVLVPVLLFWGFFGWCLAINDFVMQDIYENWAILLVLMIGVGLMLLLLLIPTVARIVLRTKALKPVFQKYAPEKAVLYGTLSCFMLPVPFLLAICRRK